MSKIKHNYESIDGWFNMEEQYIYLLSQVPENGVFVELGAYKGKSTSFIVTEIVNKNRNISFYTVDTFMGDSGSNDPKEVEAYKEANSCNLYEDYLKNTSHIKDRFKTIVGLSHEAANFFADNSVDCIFIDAGHSYESSKKDIKSWYPKIKNGGIMAGHDYNAWEGVHNSVNEFFEKPDLVENGCWFVKIKKF